MNIKKTLTIAILMIFAVGMIVGAADAASHSVKKGKYTAKLTNKDYKKLTKTEIKYKTVTRTEAVLDVDGNVEKTKKVKVKVPYKTRDHAEVQKTVGYKKIKQYVVVGHKYKTVYKYRTIKFKRMVYNARTRTFTSYHDDLFFSNDWKRVKTITKYKSDGSSIDYVVMKSTKKFPVKEAVCPIIKNIPVKKPILMNIRTTDRAGGYIPADTVYVEIYHSGRLLDKGLAIIK